MLVFEEFRFNRRDILYKENKKCVDEILADLNLKYEGISFNFYYIESVIPKAEKYFPSIKEYVTEYDDSGFGYMKKIISSIRNYENGNIDIWMDPKHYDDFDVLMSKIPRPVNFPSSSVTLDNVNWYGDQPQTRFVNPKRDIFYEFGGYYSNSIRFRKDRLFGTKFNPIEVFIERKIEGDSLSDYPEPFKMFLSKFPKPNSIELECVFDSEEQKRNEQLYEKIRGEIKSQNYDEQFKDIDEEGDDYDFFWDQLTPTSGISPKKIINRIMSKTDFDYVGYYCGSYFYKKINKNNHIITLEFTNPGFTRVMFCDFTIKGYNFSHLIYSSPQIALLEEDRLERFVKRVVEVEELLEPKYEQVMLENYGRTPGWYIENIRDFIRGI